jgi:hypothetical protein
MPYDASKSSQTASSVILIKWSIQVNLCWNCIHRSCWLAWIHIVTWRLKAGIVEPEETSSARQKLGTQVSVATDTQALIEELSGMMFSIRSVQSGYKEEFSWESAVEFRSSKWALVESWTPRGRLRRWRFEFRWQSDCDEMLRLL